ncbi:MAG: pilus assembly protein PilY, partial [Steroidobacterales bacterium]
MTSNRTSAALAALLIAGLPGIACSQQVIQDNFTGAASSFDWRSFNGACLTAGNGTGTIPACVGLPYYQGQTLFGGYSGTLPDPVGNGALRFTNGNNSGSGFANGYNQAGGVISDFTFPSGQGLQITFTTMTYRGNSGGAGGDGADGISFFLMDGIYSPYDLGAFGGSLGYTCSNTNNDPTVRADG